MADEREDVIRALSPVGPGGAAGIARRMALDMLPPGLTKARAAERLVDSLDPAVRRRVLGEVAKRLGYTLTRVDKLHDALTIVEKALSESDRVSLALRDFIDRVERDGQAVIARSADPGAAALTARCGTCSVPAIVSAGLLRLEGAGKPGALILTEDGGE